MEPLEIGARALKLGARVELVKTDLGDRERADADMCRLSVRGDETVLVQRRPFISEGYTGRRLTLHQAPTKTEVRKLEAFLDDIARNQARERAVEGHASDVSPYPAWSFTADALAMEIARMDSIDLTQCVRPARWRMIRENRGPGGRRLTVDEAWGWSCEMHFVKGAVADNAEAGSGRTTTAEMKGSSLTMRILKPKSMEMFLRELPKGMELQVKATFPETTLHGMRGRTVREVLGIDSDNVIISAHRGEHGVDYPTVLKVKGARVPLAPPPQGVDTWWLGDTETRGEN